VCALIAAELVAAPDAIAYVALLGAVVLTALSCDWHVALVASSVAAFAWWSVLAGTGLRSHVTDQSTIRLGFLLMLAAVVVVLVRAWHRGSPVVSDDGDVGVPRRSRT
jgi:hypothetical protein